MSTFPPEDAFDSLAEQLSALVDGRLTADGLERLEARLQADPVAFAEYCEFIDTEFMLVWELKCREALLTGEPLDSGPPPECQPVTIAEPCPPLAYRRRPAVWTVPLAAIATTIVIVGVVSLLSLGRKDRPPAVLARSDGARWADRAMARDGQPLPFGPLALEAGTAQIAFESGAVVAVQAPAEFEVLGRNRLLVRHGRLTPFVPESAKGFTVVSPSGEIVDLGTEFSLNVSAVGKTDVFVINGEVDVAGGHFAEARPMRLTQGFAGSLAAGGEYQRITQRPILVERFDGTATSFRVIDPESDWLPVVRHGELRIPIDGREHRKDPSVQVVVDQDFSTIVGTKSTISYKISLPPHPKLGPDRWAGLAIDPGDGPLPWAHRPGASAGILVSPVWQVGFYAAGNVATQAAVWPRQTIFPRGTPAVGPYQVVVTIDDTPATRERLGRSGLSAMVNGVEFVKDYPVALGQEPRIAFQTFLSRRYRGDDTSDGYAVIDDFSVSIDVNSEQATP